MERMSEPDAAVAKRDQERAEFVAGEKDNLTTLAELAAHYHGELIRRGLSEEVVVTMLCRYQDTQLSADDE